MSKKAAALAAAIALLISLSACGPTPPQKCVDRNGTEYVCEDDDDDDDGGWFPVFIPWSQPHSTHSPSKPKAPTYKAPAPRPAPAPKAPSYKAPSFKAPSVKVR